jgi:hypothetical protein
MLATVDVGEFKTGFVFRNGTGWGNGLGAGTHGITCHFTDETGNSSAMQHKRHKQKITGKPLIDTGQMRQSITYVLSKKDD